MSEKITIGQLREQYQQKDAELGGLLEKYQDVAEDKIPLDDYKAMKSLDAELATLQSDLADFAAEGGATKSLSDSRAQRMEALRQKPTQTFGYGVAPRNATEARNMLASAAKTLGEQFVESDTFKEYVQHSFSVSRDGKVIASDSGHLGASKTLILPNSVLALGAAKTLVTGASDTSAGAFVRNEYYPTVELPRRPLDLLDLIAHFTTTSDTVEYVRQTSRTNNAAETAESDSGSGVSKPESAIAFAKVTESVKTIAHWIPITRRALADAPQVRQYIDADLMDGVKQRILTQVIAGDGTGENFSGLETISGTGSQSFSTDIKTTIRKARTKAVKTPAYIPMGRATLLMHPDDVETLDLDTDNEARFYFGGPSQAFANIIWGMPVLESEAVTAGSAWLLDPQVLRLWDREETMIRVSDSHASYFIQNLMAILCEGRYAFGVLRPAACLELDLTA